MGLPIIIFIIVYAACLLLLLWVSKNAKNRYALAKGIQSGLFVAGALLAYFTGSASGSWDLGLFFLMLVALLFCAAGDILLGIANQSKEVSQKPFLAGAAAFIIAHIVFCIHYFLRVRFGLEVIILPILLVVLIAWFERRAWVRLGQIQRLGYIYTFIVGLMGSGALFTAWQAGLATPVGAFTAIGGILFLLSDAILVFLYFGTTRRPFYRIANLTTYYVGILFLALSLHWL